jgi:hypothetical protein
VKSCASTGERKLLGKNRAEPLFPVSKYSLNISLHQQSVRDEIEWDGIIHAVPDHCAAIGFFELMLMAPEPIWTAQLFVGKLIWRLP